MNAKSRAKERARRGERDVRGGIWYLRGVCASSGMPSTGYLGC